MTVRHREKGALRGLGQKDGSAKRESGEEMQCGYASWLLACGVAAEEGAGRPIAGWPGVGLGEAGEVGKERI